MIKAILYYVYDPMCSWCWGYQVTWGKLQNAINEQYADKIKIQYVLGGLAPDSNEPMSDELQLFLEQTWTRIHDQLGTEFNFDFWTNCQPKRSTYPACRAILVARQQALEKPMLQAIQHSYYLQVKNPSELTVLTALAEQIGLSGSAFQESMKSPLIEQQLMDEINMARGLPIQGFPSLVLQVSGQTLLIELDYLHAEKTLQQIITIIAQQQEKKG